MYAASSSTYGDSESMPKVEAIIGKPLSPYAITKYVNELYADIFSKTYGLETIGLRYFNVFGRKQDPNGAYAAVIPKFVSQLMKGESPVINGDGNYSRDFTYIDNVIQANLLSLVTTNKKAIKLIKNHFSTKNVIPLELIKSPHLPSSNALHLDCCFQPVSENKAVVCKEAFKNPFELDLLISHYGAKNIFEISPKEMSRLYSNFFSIEKNIVISDKRFHRLNKWLSSVGVKVEKVNYSEVSKLGGLFRCSTLPLIRKKD